MLSLSDQEKLCEQREKWLAEEQSKHVDGETLEQYLHRALKDCGPFKPSGFYLGEGDAIQTYCEDASSFSKQHGTVGETMHAMDDERITGLEVYGVSEIMSNCGYIVVPYSEWKRLKEMAGK